MMYASIERVNDSFEKFVDACIKYHETFTIAADKGNVVMMNEEDYKQLIAQLALLHDIQKATSTPTSELIKESPWD